MQIEPRKTQKCSKKEMGQSAFSLEGIHFGSKMDPGSLITGFSQTDIFSVIAVDKWETPPVQGGDESSP